VADQIPTQNVPQNSAEPPQPAVSQLTQTRVPLEEAGDALATKEENGRTPIVVLTVRSNRVVNGLVIAGAAVLLLSIAVGLASDQIIFGGLGTLAGIALLVFSVYSSFFVTIPEGANGLVMRRGRYDHMLGPGRYLLAPYYVISSVVTRREIPFEVPVAEAPTQDNVRATLEALVSFTISDPYKFIYNISANDFDMVLQASGQRVIRSMVHNLNSSAIASLTGMDTTSLLAELTEGVERYGVAITKVNISYATPPPDFLASHESRQLAAVQRDEQADRQALAQRRQADQEALALQARIAQVERERQEIQLQVQQAEARKRIVDLEADAEELRFARLQERLQKYPQAAEWEVSSARLEIARGLASNTRAVVEVGSTGEIARTLMMRDIIQEDNGRPTTASGNGAVNPEA
jgi:regulator of protease activity HflC (stomatin/prohibitin superfamily)